MRHQRFVILTFVVAAILAGLVLEYVAGAVILLLDQPQLQVFDLSTLVGGPNGALGFLSWFGNLASIAGFLGGVATFFVLLRNRDAVQFTDEVVGELRKVTWPSRDETLRATTTVIFTTLFVAALLYVYDTFWAFVAKQFLFSAA